MPISRHDVLHVARLACLELEEHEVEKMSQDLGQILGYVELLGELDTSGIPPTAHVAVPRAPLREDEVEATLDTETALAEAPRRSADSFAVPGFVDEG
jgi:aspartyl-tRNA(Asn)/glutamyl-tRNA(Gln) amidotransferase subunit C